MSPRLLCLAAVFALSAATLPADDARTELERAIASLREQVAALQKEEPSGDRTSVQELERRLAILADEVEKLRSGTAPETGGQAPSGLGPAASRVYRAKGGPSIAGYGEVVYENFAGQRQDGQPSGRTDRIDALRAVLYVGQRFDERFVFNSEIEFEHGSTGKGGEVSVEFAYVDFLWKPEIGVRGGMLLLPMGLVNELHEPTVFLGATRNSVERTLLPSTWRENGIGLLGDLGPVTYRTYLVNGLRAEAFSASGIRGGRQSGAQAAADDFAWVGRLDLTSVPGLLVGASAYLGDSGQGLKDAEGHSLSVSTRIVEAHVDWRWRGLQARALGSVTSLGGVAELNEALGLEAGRSVGSELAGGYVELGYDLLATRSHGGRSLVVFARGEALDTQREVPAGFERDPARRVRTLTFGLALKPIERIVLKADYQSVRNDAEAGVDQLNVALGWVF